ncbi:iron transporter [Mesorhizobium sp. VK25A]|uniref:Iron transporter n=1 Tax=Mesorhizobium vachelliae TaxID=3072309 RepID=A0ABU5AEA7_9HYPH|nr:MULTISPECIES: iron transporter [unclassified Mesorhizobium]MDX8535609.1 iron transporter [Mesorhizobium sp. VK25D]MDX8548362.1 iron transporter [Mesorhizobium sp. VK25A]
MSCQSILFSSIAALLAGASSVCAMEYPIGKPQLMNGMEIGAVYLQPIEMEPANMMKPAADSDIHLEADIHAARGNANGFAEGDWIPNLQIEYRLIRIDDNQQNGGVLMPMVASDGPHYGDNVKLMGPGKYRLDYTISFEESGGHSPFGRHVDKETGVAAWPEPFHIEYEFTFAGVGKKGGY